MIKYSRYTLPVSGLLLIILFVSACQTISISFATPAARSTVSGTAAKTSTLVHLVTATPQPSPSITPVPLKVNAGNTKGAQVIFWHSWSGTGRQALEDLIYKFNQNNSWGIVASIKAEGDAQTLYSEIENNQTENNDNGLPNLILAAPEQIASLNDQSGNITNLDSYISSEYGLSKDERSAIADAYWKQDRSLSNVQTGLPALRNLHVLFYNQTWAQELGFSDAPTTPDTFKQQACAAAKAVQASATTNKNTVNGTGGWIVDTKSETLLSWMYAFGSLTMPNRSSQPYNFSTKSNEQMLTYLTGLFSSNCAWNSRLSTPYTYFANRQALFYSGSLEDIVNQSAVNIHLSATDQWKVIPYPNQNTTPVPVSSGLSYAVIHSDDNRDLAAWLLARWLNQPENMVVLAKASGLMPSDSTALSKMQDYGDLYPQWKEAIDWLTSAQTTPGIGSWQAARQVLSDAGWMAFNPKPTPDSPSTVLDMLDKTIYDVLLHRP